MFSQCEVQFAIDNIKLFSASFLVSVKLASDLHVFEFSMMKIPLIP
jgi:hypothetical protein